MSSVDGGEESLATDPTPSVTASDGQALVAGQTCNVDNHRPDPRSTSGLAAIKPEFLTKDTFKQIDTKYLTETVTKPDTTAGADNGSSGGRTADGDQKETNGSKKQRFRGQNKSRRKQMRREFNDNHFNNQINGKKLCLSFVADGQCSYGDRCCHSHDLQEYHRQGLRPADIGDTCYLYDRYGKCPYGVICRFGGQHLADGYTNVVDEDKWRRMEAEKRCDNLLAKELQLRLRKRTYDFAASKEVCDRLQRCDSAADTAYQALKSAPRVKPTVGAGGERQSKSVDFAGKTYLAPLTTVGNLPFRRVCKRLGADITCGEMAMASNLLEGQQSEWALLRRHPSEDIFGVQICGANPQVMSRCAQLLHETCSVDFIDVNMGCPIDMVYQKGAGSGLMDRHKKLDQIIYGMSSVIDCPLTLKMRTGVYQHKNIAHKVIAAVKEWGDGSPTAPGPIGLMTIHGRSREQRYTKHADWRYIAECSALGRPIPVFGSGDVLGHEEYYERLDSGAVDGVMIARGALIKPWIFTEIKERRVWDISAAERLDIVREFANYGLENWGSDDEGVTKTRRFLLEWLSFLCRYIPVGVLERLPQRINERPPPFVGRNELETLLSSGSCADWLKISEMFLGKVPDGFTFYPKHKANAY